MNPAQLNCCKVSKSARKTYRGFCEISYLCCPSAIVVADDRNDKSSMVHFAVHITARKSREKKKPPCPNLDQAMRLVLFAKLTCILNESASHF
jgi:hypothetical protein